MRCLLVSANRAQVPYPVYPLGLAHIAGALEAEGFHTRLFDVLAEDGLSRLGKVIEDYAPGLVVLSIRNLDNVDSTGPVSFIEDAIKAVELVRASSDVPIVAGGPAFSLFPRRLMDLLGVEWGVVGQGEGIVPRIAGSIESGRPLPGGILRASGPAGEWRPVKYDGGVASYYISAGGMLNIQSKRGCPFKCTYCSYPGIEGRVIRRRDPGEVAEDVARVTRDFGAKYIFFTDAVFNDPGGHYLEVAEALARAGNETPWCAFFRPSGIGRADLRLLRSAGLAGMEVGTDGSTDETLKGLGKNFTFDQVIRFNDLAVEEGIPCAHFCMFGGPGETERTIQRGIANLERLREAVVFGFAGIRVLPGTLLYETALHEGIVPPGHDMLKPVFYFAPGLEFDTVDSCLRKAWGGRLDRIYPCSILYQYMSRLYSRGYAGPLWDILVRHGV